jgi:CheY-like chemotaxis protein
MASAITFKGSDFVDLVTGLAWPVVVGLVLWRLLPGIRDVIRSRGFTVSAGGMEISVQAASDQLATRLDDVRDQVAALKSGAPAAEATGEGIRELKRVLWVDDYPQNNAFEMDALQRKGVDVLVAKRTAEALGLLKAHPDVRAVISDLGRDDDGQDAGVQLLRALAERGEDLPVLIYSSAPAVARWGDAARAAGARLVTSSATELMDTLAHLGGTLGAPA